MQIDQGNEAEKKIKAVRRIRCGTKTTDNIRKILTAQWKDLHVPDIH